MTLALGAVLLTAAVAVGSPVAIWPFQEFGEGRNDADLVFTRLVAERLAEGGTQIVDPKAVMAFMASNRIRSVGHLDSYNISRVRTDLGVPFVLLGTVTQRKERPEPSMGISLQLVRTSDARTVWTFVDSVSTGEERRILGVGEPQSTTALQYLLLDEIVQQWPWNMIKEDQSSGFINIDSAVLEPRFVQPGEEVHCMVIFRNSWSAGQEPRVFFRVEDQLYPATVAADGRTYKGSWVVGEKNGRFPVTLLLSWPRYGRVVTTMLGSYTVDGKLPVLKLELAGVKIVNGIPVFSENLVILPRMLVRKPMSHWRLAFYEGDGNLWGDMQGDGNLPESFVWKAEDRMGSLRSGIYEVVVEAWDKAGNLGKASRRVELNRSYPSVSVTGVKEGNQLVVSLKTQGTVPLAYWRMKTWTEDGKLLSHAEGTELPYKIGVDLPASGKNQNIQGTLFVQDIFGNKAIRKIKNLLPQIGEKDQAKEKEKKSKGIAETWVDEF